MAKKKVKKAGMHQEVHHVWGWVVLVLGALMIFSVVGYYFLMNSVI
jgi:hypothetical protein